MSSSPSFFRGRRRACCVALLALTVAVGSLGWAKTAVVKLKDGSTLEGQLISESPAALVLRTRQGIEMRIARENVAGVEYREDPELEFASRRRELDAADVEGRVRLARFALESRLPEQARDVLVEALSLDPNHREARELYASARAQIEIDRRTRERGVAPSAPPEVPAPAPTRPSGTDPEPGTEPEPAAPATGRVVRPMLDADQINAVKQAEYRKGDPGVTFRFDNDVINRFAKATGRTPSVLRQLSAAERFDLMRNHPLYTPTMADDIRVLRDPEPIVEYRQVVRPLLVGCATSGCHGGPNAGSFWLLSPADHSSEAAMYTNFFILATREFSVRSANGKQAVRPLIDRVVPEQSLLLQFALSADHSQTPHPVVPGFRAAYRTPQDPRYRTILRWVEGSLTPIRPDYSGIRFGDWSTHGSSHSPLPTTLPSMPTPGTDGPPGVAPDGAPGR